MFLDETLDADKIADDYAAGVLTLTIRVHENAKPRNIQVTSSDTRQASPSRSAPASGAGRPQGRPAYSRGQMRERIRERSAARRLDGLRGPSCSNGY